MSIWDLHVPSSEPTLEVKYTELEEVDLSSIRPFAAKAIGSIVTHHGRAHNYIKPNGRFHCVDRDAVNKVAQRIRNRKAEHFKLMVEAEEALTQTFSKEPWPEPMPSSGVRTKIIQTFHRFTKTLRGV